MNRSPILILITVYFYADSIKDNKNLGIQEYFYDANYALEVWNFYKSNLDEVIHMNWKDNLGGDRSCPTYIARAKVKLKPEYIQYLNSIKDKLKNRVL